MGAVGRRLGAFLLVPVICLARWSEVDGRIGGIATGATIAADADNSIEGMLIALEDWRPCRILGRAVQL